MSGAAHDFEPGDTAAAGRPNRAVAAAVQLAVLALVVVAVLLGGQVRAGVSVSTVAGDPGRLLNVRAAVAGWDGDNPARAGAHSWLRAGDDGGPVRWGSCSPIRWVSNAAAAAPGALADLRAAFAEVSTASGVEFVEVGVTDKVPTLGDWMVEGADLVVAWATADQTDYLTGARTDAYGVSSPYFADGAYASAAVVIDAGAQDEYTAGFGDGETRGKLLLHELGHVLGLNHVDDATQVMNDTISDRFPSELGAGDLAGLRAVGCPTPGQPGLHP